MLAKNGEISYREAVRRFCRRRRSLAVGHPAAAGVLDYASTYRYNDGQIAYLHDAIIRFRDLRLEKECSKLSVDDLFSLIPPADRRRLELLAVQDSVLVIGIATIRWTGLSNGIAKRYVRFKFILACF